MDLHLTQKHPVTLEAPGHDLMWKPSAINSQPASWGNLAEVACQPCLYHSLTCGSFLGPQPTWHNKCCLSILMTVHRLAPVVLNMQQVLAQRLAGESSACFLKPCLPPVLVTFLYWCSVDCPPKHRMVSFRGKTHQRLLTAHWFSSGAVAVMLLML